MRSGVDYDTMRLGSLRFVPEGDEVSAWGRDYEAMREVMFYGEPPRFATICDDLRTFQADINEGA